MNQLRGIRSVSPMERGAMNMGENESSRGRTKCTGQSGIGRQPGMAPASGTWKRKFDWG